MVATSHFHWCTLTVLFTGSSHLQVNRATKIFQRYLEKCHTDPCHSTPSVGKCLIASKTYIECLIVWSLPTTNNWQAGLCLSIAHDQRVQGLQLRGYCMWGSFGRQAFPWFPHHVSTFPCKRCSTQTFNFRPMQAPMEGRTQELLCLKKLEEKDPFDCQTLTGFSHVFPYFHRIEAIYIYIQRAT